MDPVEDEWYAVRYSGEMPEVALHASLYFLTQDSQGPRLVLSAAQYRRLVAAAAERFREIILRDLAPENRDLSLYRGIRRAITNWGRFISFCQRQSYDPRPLQQETAVALQVFLNGEIADIGKGRQSSVNCSFVELQDFAEELGIGSAALPHNLDGVFD